MLATEVYDNPAGFIAAYVVGGLAIVCLCYLPFTIFGVVTSYLQKTKPK